MRSLFAHNLILYKQFSPLILHLFVFGFYFKTVKMALKFIIALALIGFVLIQSTQEAPLESKQEQALVQSFVEFLHQDKELATALQKLNLGDNLVARHRRQVEEPDSDEEQEVDTENKAGFFDRAAKFVMEVLQRFLKWINTDN